MARGELRGGCQRFARVLHAVVLFVPAAQPLEDPNRLFDRRLFDGDFLQPPRQRAVFFDVLELLEGRRSDDAKIACAQNRLDERGQVHGAARHGAGPHRGVDLVDEQDRPGPPAQRADDRLEPFFEVAAKPCACQQRPRVEREYLRLPECVLHTLLDEARRQPFGHRGLADAGIADEHGIVLAAPAQDLDRALKLRRAADKRIEQALTRAGRQVDAVRGERIERSRGTLVPHARGGGRSLFVGSAQRHLRDAMRDVFEDVEARDTLRGQEMRGVSFGLLEDRREEIAGLDFLPLRTLDVEHRRLEHAAKRRGLLRIAFLTPLEPLDRFVEVAVEVAPEPRQIGAAGLENALPVGVVGQRVQQVLERQVQVAA